MTNHTTIQSSITAFEMDSQKWLTLTLEYIDSLPKAKLSDIADKVGSFSDTSKMPCKSWGIPADDCQTGSKLVEVEGSSCAGCYAKGGAYKWTKVFKAYKKRLETVKENGLFEWMINMIRYFLTSRNFQSKGVFRWFDSGDLQSAEMLKAINIIAYATNGENLKSTKYSHINILHWLPTKEPRYLKHLASDYRALNLIPRQSAPFKNQIIDSKHTPYTSTVLTVEKFDQIRKNPELVPDMTLCLAFENNNECGNCRACWEVPKVGYRYHGEVKHGNALEKFS